MGLKTFFTAKKKKNSTKQKDKLLNGRKIFANDMSNKGLISTIYKQLTQLNIKKMNNPIKNGQKT